MAALRQRGWQTGPHRKSPSNRNCVHSSGPRHEAGGEVASRAVKIRGPGHGQRLSRGRMSLQVDPAISELKTRDDTLLPERLSTHTFPDSSQKEQLKSQDAAEKSDLCLERWRGEGSQARGRGTGGNTGQSVLWVGSLPHIPDVVLKMLETQKQQQKPTKKAATNDCSL